MKRTALTISVLMALILLLPQVVPAPTVGVGPVPVKRVGTKVSPLISGDDFSVSGTNRYYLNNSSIYDSGGTGGFANSGSSWTAFGSGSSSIAGTNISISGDTISVVDPPTFDSANIGGLGVSVVTFQDALVWTDPGNAPNPALVGMISYSAQSSWRTTVGQYYFVSGPSNWQIIDWFHPLTGTNISYSGDTLSVINNPSFSSTTTLAGATVMSGEAGTAGWYVKLDGSGNVSLGDPSGGTVNSFVNWAYGGTTIVADSPTDTVTLIEGSNISFAMSPAADSLTITASGGGAPIAGTNISVSGQTVSMIASLADAYVADTITVGSGSTVAAASISGSITSAQIAADMARDSELFAGTFVALSGSASDSQIPDNITISALPAANITGSIADAQIVAAIARDIELFGGNFSDLAGSATDSQIPDNVTILSSAISGNITSAQIDADMARDSELFGGNFSDLAGSITDAQLINLENISNGGTTASWVLATDGAGDSYWKVDATGGGGANSFETWNVENGTDPVADLATDVIIIYDGTGITVTGDANDDSITIAYSGAFSGVSGSIATAQVPTDITIDTRTVAQGGTGTTSLTDGGILLGSGTGAITPMAVLADSAMIVGDGTTDPVAESGATLRTSIGVGTGDTPQLTGIEVGAATDTTLSRKSAGVLQVEANELYVQGGTDVADADVVDDLTVTSTKAISTTSTINGLVNVTSTTAATLVLTATTCASDLHINGDNDAIDYTLPTAVAGQNCGFYTPFDAIMTVDTANTGDSIILGGTTLTAGNAVDSASSAGSYAYFMAISASQWSIIGEIKTWVDGGAD